MSRSVLFDLVKRAKPPTGWSALVCAHRGASHDTPENTLVAFERACDAGADLVEFDVHVSADGDVIVIHDDKVDRTTNGRGEIRRMKTREIQELDAGAWFPGGAFQGERVPTLDETLDVLRGRAVPVVEIKVKRRKSIDCGARVVACLERHGMLDKAVVIAREPERAREVREASPQVALAYITYTKRQARAAAKLPGVRGLDIYWKSISLSLIEDLRKSAGFFLTPWTVNRRADQEKLLLLGLETLITDYPARLRDLIERFEFSRSKELLDRFRATGEDVDLESKEHPSEDKAPADVARELGTTSEVDIDVVE